MEKTSKDNLEKSIQKKLENVPESNGKTGRQTGITNQLVQDRLEYAASLRLRQNFTYYTILKMINAKDEEKGWGIMSLSTLQKELPRYIVGKAQRTSEEKQQDSELARQEMIQSLYADVEHLNTVLISKVEIKTTKTDKKGNKIETVTPKMPSYGQKGYLLSVIKDVKSQIAKLEGWEQTNVVQNNNFTKNEITINERARKEYSDPKIAGALADVEEALLAVGPEGEDGRGHDSDRNIVEGVTDEPEKPKVENA